jgi:hypothetical protein
MLSKALVTHILHNETLTRGLGDPEARILVEWLVDRAEMLAEVLPSEGAAWAEVRALCRRARSIARFVMLWCARETRAGAVQLAAVERFAWPLPATGVDPCELMHAILTWEGDELARREVTIDK